MASLWHQPRSQGFFPNAERLIGFLFQLIAQRQERTSGNQVEWACIIAEFSNSRRTNSFHKVGSRESSSYGTEEEHQKNQNKLSTKKVFHISESRSDIQQNRGGGLTAGSWSAPQNPPAAKFASQGGAHVRTGDQIKFLYYPLTLPSKHLTVQS